MTGASPAEVMAAAKDYYQILGVSPTAGVNDIKKAYRRLAQKYNPHARPGSPRGRRRAK